MANITARKNKDGNIISYRIRCRRGRENKPYEMTWKVPDNLTKKQIERELNKVVAEFQYKCDNNMISTERYKFSDYAEYVIQLREKNNDIKHSTANRYTEFLERINDVDICGFGYLKVSEINAKHLNDFYIALSKDGLNKKTKGGLSPKTILEYHRFIHMVFKQALKESLVPFNVADRATPPKVVKHEAEFYEAELIQKIIAALESEDLKWKAFMYLLISSGCRVGEILGLKWSAVNFKSNQIHICNSVRYEGDLGLYDSTPKTERSDRNITISKNVMDVLKQWKANQSQETKIINRNGYCFTQADGVSPMYRQSVSDFLDRFSKRHDLPHLHAHGFRHSVATELINQGMDIVSVSAKLGHAQTSTTANIYAHALQKAETESADIIQDSFFGNITK